MKSRIVFTLPNLQGGGAERVVLNLIKGLDRDRFQPALFLLRKSGVLWDEIPADVSIFWASEDGGRIRQRLVTTLREISSASFRPDLIVGGMELDATYYAYCIGKFWRSPVIGWVHTLIEPYLERVPAYHRGLVKLIYPRLSRLIFPSADALESMVRLAGVDSKRARIIPNPIDLQGIRLRACQPLPDWAATIFSKPVVMGIGRLEYGKGFDLLLKAHFQLRKEGVDHHVLILGEGEARRDLNTLVQENGAESSVFMPGYIANPYPFLKRAAVLAHPARMEGFGMVILEALAFGVPVVAARCSSGPVEILENGRYGMVVEPENEGAIASAVRNLLLNPGISDTLRQIGPERAAAFNLVDITRQWDQFLCQPREK